MSPRPVVSDLTERVYDLLSPLHSDDAANGYGLLILSSSAAAMMEESFGWSSGDDGSEPWQHLLDDPELSAGVSNDFLAQLLGVSVRTMSPSLSIALMQYGLTYKRGTVEYLAAVFAHLAQTIIAVYERLDADLNVDPYSITIRSYVAISEAVMSQLHAWKPAGLIMHLVDSADLLYIDLGYNPQSYTELAAGYATYADIDW